MHTFYFPACHLSVHLKNNTIGAFKVFVLLIWVWREKRKAHNLEYENSLVVGAGMQRAFRELCRSLQTTDASPADLSSLTLPAAVH